MERLWTVLLCFLILWRESLSFSRFHHYVSYRRIELLGATSTMTSATIKKADDTGVNSALAQWASEQGVEFKKLCIGKEANSGRRGLFATEQINVGETILKVPLTLCFQSNEVDGSNWPVDMALRLLEECARGHESKYAPYIASLPKPMELVLPSQWPEAVMLENVIFAEAVELVKTWRERILDDPKLIETLDERVDHDIATLSWALNIIQTRNCKCTAFSSWYLKSSGSNVNILAPIFDLLNHSDDAKTTFYQSDGFLCLDTTVGYARDQEVFLNYGEHCPFTLLAKYGFWPDESPKNVLPILLPRNLTLPLLLQGGEERLEVLQSMNILISGTFQLHRDGEIPDDLMLALMVILASESDMEQILILMASNFEIFECIFDGEVEDDEECGRKASKSLLNLIMRNLQCADNLQKASVKTLLGILEKMREEDYVDERFSIEISKEVTDEVVENIKTTRKGFQEYKLKLISDATKCISIRY